MCCLGILIRKFIFRLLPFQSAIQVREPCESVRQLSSMPASESALSLPPSHASQSSLWGTSTFKGCRYCRRDRTHPNPVVASREEKPTLQFKSDRHSECLPCCGKIRRCNPTLSTSESRASYAKKLQDCDQSYLQHMNELADYEQLLQEPAVKRRCRSVSATGEAWYSILRLCLAGLATVWH